MATVSSFCSDATCWVMPACVMKRGVMSSAKHTLPYKELCIIIMYQNLLKVQCHLSSRCGTYTEVCWMAGFEASELHTLYSHSGTAGHYGESTEV